MINLFKWDSVQRRVSLDDVPGMALISEFAELLKEERNITKSDKKGEYKDRAFREFAYIYLMLDWRSPYADYVEADRHQAAIQDSGLTEEEFNDEAFRAACRKYREIQEGALEWRLIQSAKTIVNKFIIYFNTVDPTVTDEVTGKPIYKVKDIMGEVTNLSGVVEELKKLEYMFKKQADVPNALRGGVQEGFDPRKVKVS